MQDVRHCAIIVDMNVNLAKYSDMNICVAVSGGKDSMALLHYIFVNGSQYGIRLTALNCDHGIRGETSARDSAFVKDWCTRHDIPLMFFKTEQFFKNENFSRLWRLNCYVYAATPRQNTYKDRLYSDKPVGTQISIFPENHVWQGADAVATAHHLNDNAETILFNLARGSALSGVTGITDYSIDGAGNGGYSVIRPLIECSREDIDAYIAENAIEYVTDETNLTDDYTRNKIRHNVLPELEKAVTGATKAIYRFSRLAAEDEKYFKRQTKKLRVKSTPYGEGILFCEERVLFRRAAIEIINEYRCKDYTSEHAERLYDLQFAQNGKKFEFLGLTAFKEEDRITIIPANLLSGTSEEIQFINLINNEVALFCGQTLVIAEGEDYEKHLERILKMQATDERIGFHPEGVKCNTFDLDSVPENAVVRFMHKGDKFKKFGGGEKNLGNFFTDRKIPVRIRRLIPLIVAGEHDVLAVCGVEISDKIKTTSRTRRVGYIIAADYADSK